MEKFILIQEAYGKGSFSIITAISQDDAYDKANEVVDQDLSSAIVLPLSEAKRLASFIISHQEA